MADPNGLGDHAIQLGFAVGEPMIRAALGGQRNNARVPVGFAGWASSQPRANHLSACETVRSSWVGHVDVHKNKVEGVCGGFRQCLSARLGVNGAGWAQQV